MVFRRGRLLSLVVVALLIASCGGDAVSFEGQRAADAANTPANVEPVAPQPTVKEAPTDEPIEPTVSAEPTDTTVEEPAADDQAALDREAAVERRLEILESAGGMVWVDAERECVRDTLIAADDLDPTTDTQVLNCLGENGVPRWVSAYLASWGGGARAIIEPTESLCVWEQSDGQVLSIDIQSSPAIQRCGVWGRVNLGGWESFSDETLACLDIQMQTTRLPNGSDRAAVDDRVGQCATADELAVWSSQ